MKKKTENITEKTEVKEEVKAAAEESVTPVFSLAQAQAELLGLGEEIGKEIADAENALAKASKRLLELEGAAFRTADSVRPEVIADVAAQITAAFKLVRSGTRFFTQVAE